MSVRIPIALTLACGHSIKYLPNWLAPIGFGISPKSISDISCGNVRLTNFD